MPTSSADGSLVLSADLQSSGKPNQAGKTLGRNEAVVYLRLLRLEVFKSHETRASVKATLTARRPRAAWTAAAFRAKEHIWRRRSKKAIPEVTFSVDRGSRLMEGCPSLHLPRPKSHSDGSGWRQTLEIFWILSTDWRTSRSIHFPLIGEIHPLNEYLFAIVAVIAKIR